MPSMSGLRRPSSRQVPPSRQQQRGIPIAVEAITGDDRMGVDLLHPIAAHQGTYQHEQGNGDTEFIQ